MRLFGKVGEEISTIVTITPESKYPFRILEVKPRGKTNVRCRLEETEGSQGSYKLVIENIRNTQGRYSEAISIKTDSEIQPEMRIFAYGNILAGSTPASKTEPKTDQTSDKKSDAAQSE